MHELLLGGQKSGKSRAAEARAAAWLAGAPGREARLLATALAADEEMAQRIARHRVQRAALLPALTVQEVGADLAAALRAASTPQRLVVVDCLTLWLTQLMLPPPGQVADGQPLAARLDALLTALAGVPGPVVLVSNEIGLGVLPLGRETRAFVDTLGALHQQLAARCERVTLMVAGLALTVKPAAPPAVHMGAPT